MRRPAVTTDDTTDSLQDRVTAKAPRLTATAGRRYKRAVRGPGAAVAAVFAAVALVPLAGGVRSDAQTLYVTFLVTGGFRVTLPDGTPIGTPSPPGTTIPPGTYELVFDNTSNVKNVDFQLTGPNVSLQEDMGGGEETAAGDYVTFQPSSQYRYHDANNVSSPFVFLQTAASGGSQGGTGAGIPGSNSTSSGSSTSNATVVGTKAGSSTAASGSTAKALYRGTLAGTVAAAGSVALTVNGKPVTTLRAGRYTIQVADRSTKGGFTIQAINKDPTTITGLAFVGSRKATLTLSAGQWLYYPTFVAKKTYFLVTR
jgi:hypothetical protein